MAWLSEGDRLSLVGRDHVVMKVQWELRENLFEEQQVVPECTNPHHALRMAALWDLFHTCRDISMLLLPQHFVDAGPRGHVGGQGRKGARGPDGKSIRGPKGFAGRSVLHLIMSSALAHRSCPEMRPRHLLGHTPYPTIMIILIFHGRSVARLDAMARG